MFKSTNSNNLRPMYIKDNIVKGDKIDIRLYLLQEVKGYRFLRINEERYNEDIHQ